MLSLFVSQQDLGKPNLAVAAGVFRLMAEVWRAVVFKQVSFLVLLFRLGHVRQTFIISGTYFDVQVSLSACNLTALKLPIVINQTCDQAAQTKIQQLANKVL